MQLSKIIQPLCNNLNMPIGGFRRLTHQIGFTKTTARPTTRTFATKKSTFLTTTPQHPSSSIILPNAASVKTVPKDNTASVYLENPPPSTEEDKEAAAYLGVNHFYRGGNNHFYMIQFEPDKDTSLDSYLDHTKLEFFGKIPYGSISEVQLSQTLLTNVQDALQTNEVECKALFFDKKRQPNDMQRVAELLFVIKTPGGFWNVSCHSNYYHLTTNKDQLFGNVLKNLRIELRKNKIASAKRTSEENVEDAVVTGILTPKKKKFLRKRVTSKAPVGSLNLVTQKDDVGAMMEDDLLD